MDRATASFTTPPSCSADTLRQGRTDPSPPPTSVVAQRQIMKAGALGSPVRRSPCPSYFLPPRPPMRSRDQGSDDESESANGVVLPSSREETPENDILPPDEPSTVLANRILRAHGNPSPPPQGVAHPGTGYVSEKEGQSPSHGVSAPPSPFRPINLLERLNQLSGSPFDPSPNLSTPASGDQLGTLRSNTLPTRGFISPGSCSPSVPLTAMQSTSHEDQVSADTLPLPSTQHLVNDLPSRSPQHVCELASSAKDVGTNSYSQLALGLYGKLITATGSVNFEVPTSSSAQTVDPSLNPVVSRDLHVRTGESLPSYGRQNCCESPPIVPDTTPPSPPSSKGVVTSSPPRTTVSCGQDHGEEYLSTADDDLPVSKENRESENTNEDDANFYRRQSSLLSHPPQALPEPIDQTILPVESTCMKHLPATPSQAPQSPVTRPNGSLSVIKRPIVAPTPVRANSSARRITALSGANDVCRTPARRVPIESVPACGTSSSQKILRPSTGPDPFQMGRFPMIRGLVFARPALDDPFRSPAKRIPVTDMATSPRRGDQSQSSPMRTSLRARSASVEPRPLGSILTRSRSVEPCPAISKPDSHERVKSSVFSTLPIPPRSSAKLPFPLVPIQESTSDLPPSTPEEKETVDIGGAGADATLSKLVQGSMSQLRQPTGNSRIPRIGNKPYARPPSKNGKATAGTTAQTVGTPKAPLFRLAYEDHGAGKTKKEVSNTQPARDLLLIGSLKRKRGAEAASSSSHPIMMRQVVPGILSKKYAPKSTNVLSQIPPPSESSLPKVTQPIKFRKVVDGMLSARYAPVKANLARAELPDSTLSPPSSLSDLSSSSNEELSEEKLSAAHPPTCSKNETSDPPQGGAAFVAEPSTHNHTSILQDTNGGESVTRPRRTSRARKPAQQQYVLDVFNGKTAARPPPARRRPQPRTEGDGFMGMSATALKALTTSNTTKNQQSVAVLATEVIRKEGLRPESPTVKARTILQKQRDERDTRRRERAQRRTQVSDGGPGTSDIEGPGDGVALDGRADHDENDYTMPLKHRRGPGDEDDYETTGRFEHIEPLRLDGTERMAKSVKQVKWHRGLSTAVYLDEVDSKPRPLPRNDVVRGCLAPTSKNLPLDPLGNLVDIDNRPLPELAMEQITVKRYLYDNDIEPEPIPTKVTRSKSKRK